MSKNNETENVINKEVDILTAEKHRDREELENESKKFAGQVLSFGEDMKKILSSSEENAKKEPGRLKKLIMKIVKTCS